MGSFANPAPRAILFGLEPVVEAELSASLRGAACAVSLSLALSPVPDCASGEGTGASIVFCPRGTAFKAARAAFPNLPVVIVSRLPDTHEWLDALELGAADYVAAPFESVHMRWLLEAHDGRNRPAAVASDTQDMHMPKCA